MPQIRTLAARAASVHVLFNNNYRDYGVRNARQMTSLLGLAGGGPAGPDERREASSADNRKAPGQQRLL